MEVDAMSFGLLSQMEDIKHRRENSLKTIGQNTTMIVVGSIVLIAGIVVSAFMGIIIGTAGQSTSTESSGGEIYAVCAGIFGFLGFIGIVILLIGIICRAKFNHELVAAEN